MLEGIRAPPAPGADAASPSLADVGSTRGFNMRRSIMMKSFVWRLPSARKPGGT